MANYMDGHSIYTNMKIKFCWMNRIFLKSG